MSSSGLWSSVEQRPCGVWSCFYHYCWSSMVINSFLMVDTVDIFFHCNSHSSLCMQWSYAFGEDFCNYISLNVCFWYSLRCQLPVERLGTSGYFGHDKLLCGHPVHLHVSICCQAIQRHSRYLVLRSAVPSTLPSCCFQNTHRHCARELQGPHQAAGWLAPEELHSAHQQHRHRALREILLSCWPWWSQHVYLPRLRWAQSFG